MEASRESSVNNNYSRPSADAVGLSEGYSPEMSSKYLQK